MVHRIAFWSVFGRANPHPPSHSCSLFANEGQLCLAGLAARFWQMGIEMRPFFNRGSLWVYPVYAAGGASFGYWLQGVDDKQTGLLTDRKEALLEKRARKAARDAEAAASA